MNYLFRAILILAGVLAGGMLFAAAPGNTAAPASNNLLQQALKGPLAGANEIVFCTRAKYEDGHWYANIGYYCDDENHKARAGNGQPDIGKLVKLNLQTGAQTVLLDAMGGSVRDPQVHYDARKIIFSYRPAGTEFYHLYEIGVDGSGLRQLTKGDFDDYEPSYLADGGIVFVSTRCRRWVNCWMTQVGTIHRCDAEGGHIRQISGNTEHDNTPWPLPDGRILYTRWEYVDRSQVEYHSLWAMNPDGTGQSVYYGNMHSWIVMIDAKPIPGTDKVLASFSPGHGANEHAGIATVVSPNMGPDDRASAVGLHKGKLVKDPYPLAEDLFLAARGNEIVLMNDRGQTETLYTLKETGGVNEPRPIVSRPRERLLQSRSDWQQATGNMVLADVYNGRNMPGVKRGDIKKLLILESLPKPVNFSGGQDLLTWLGTFTLERVLGTVPVEADGSAFFEVPANRQLFFVGLDEHDLSVKRMQSFTCVMPGETLSCVGCHEHRALSPEIRPVGTLQALKRTASVIEPFKGFPDVVDFHRDVQPVLDKYCVSCHRPEKRDGCVLLNGDLGLEWSISYYSLLASLQVADGRNGLGNQPPRALGSSASPLLKKGDGTHYNVKYAPQDWRTLWLWIESGATYAGTYGGLRNEKTQNRQWSAHPAVFGEQSAVMHRRCGTCHTFGGEGQPGKPALPFHHDDKKLRAALGRPTGQYERLVVPNDPSLRYSANILVNCTRPEQSSLLLGPLAKAAGGYGTCGEIFKDRNDPDYLLLLGGIRKAKTILDAEPRFGTEHFKPNYQYVRELKKYGVLPANFDLARDPLNVFEADQRYWRTLWTTGGGE